MIKSRKNIPIRAVFYVVILIFVMIQVYPIFWVICSSLKTPDEMTYTAQYALPSGFYLGNYISALTISSIPRYFLNSTVVAVLTLLGIVVLGCPVAFVIPMLRKLHFGQTILEDGPKWHKKKQGTPIMGGFMFIKWRRATESGDSKDAVKAL